MTKYPGLSRAIGALATSGIVATGMAALAAGPASAATLTCGMTITSSITLHRNLNCRNYAANPAGGAITIGAAGLTVNLNGHTITGPGISVEATGIFDNGYSGLTVTGGRLNDFYDAVDVQGTNSTTAGLLPGVVIEHLTISAGAPVYGSDSYGVYGQYLTGARVHNVTVNDAEYGIELDNSHNSVVSYNRVQSANTSLYDYEGAGDAWSHNTVTDAIDYGFYADITAGTSFSHNNVTGTATDGVGAYENTGLTITRNKFGSTYDSVYSAYDTGTSVSYNKSSHSSWGIYAYEATGATFSHNTLSSGVFGIEADYPYGVRLVRNVTNGNADTGVYIYDNLATPSTPYAARLVHNTANHNRFGLYSQFATTGYGNRAVHNTALNCYNVACVRAALALAGHRAPAHLAPRAPQAPTPGLAVKR